MRLLPRLALVFATLLPVPAQATSFTLNGEFGVPGGLAELAGWCRGALSADRFAQADGELRARGLVSAPLGRKPSP